MWCLNPGRELLLKAPYIRRSMAGLQDVKCDVCKNALGIVDNDLYQDEVREKCCFCLSLCLDDWQTKTSDWNNYRRLFVCLFVSTWCDLSLFQGKIQTMLEDICHRLPPPTDQAVSDPYISLFDSFLTFFPHLWSFLNPVLNFVFSPTSSLHIYLPHYFSFSSPHFSCRKVILSLPLGFSFASSAVCYCQGSP